jgi:hypothetical protein
MAHGHRHMCRSCHWPGPVADDVYQAAVDEADDEARAGAAREGFIPRLAERFGAVSASTLITSSHQLFNFVDVLLPCDEASNQVSMCQTALTLCRLAESSNLLLTPFERNIQLWRQLWRVLERSHLIVQIVDARNPLGFRCVDLEAYVHETGSDEEDAAVPGKGKRRSLLLINKADLLTKEQR